jgi:hypothetical protein
MTCVYCRKTPHDMMAVLMFVTESREFLESSPNFEDVYNCRECKMQVRPGKESDFILVLWQAVRCYLSSLLNDQIEEGPDYVAWTNGTRSVRIRYNATQLIFYCKEKGISTDSFGIEVRNCLIYENLIAQPFDTLHDLTKRLEDKCLMYSEQFVKK